MHLPSLLALPLLLGVGVSLAQVSPNLEIRAEGIREAAVKIWRTQRLEGNAKAISETNECRARLLKTKTTYDTEVEACLVVDFYVSMSTASFYSQMSEEYRRANKIDPEKIRQDAGRRIESAFVYFKLTPAEAKEAIALFKENVFPAVAIEAGLK